MDPFIDSYRSLIEVFGFSKVKALEKRVSSYCMSLLEYVLEHEFKNQKLKEKSLQDFANSIFNPFE